MKKRPRRRAGDFFFRFLAPRTHRRRAVARLNVLRLGQLDEHLGRRVEDLHVAHDRRAVVRDNDLAVLEAGGARGGGKGSGGARARAAQEQSRASSRSACCAPLAAARTFPWIILSMPRGPSEVRTASATPLAARMLAAARGKAGRESARVRGQARALPTARARARARREIRRTGAHVVALRRSLPKPVLAADAAAARTRRSSRGGRGAHRVSAVWRRHAAKTNNNKTHARGNRGLVDGQQVFQGDNANTASARRSQLSRRDVRQEGARACHGERRKRGAG